MTSLKGILFGSVAAIALSAGPTLAQENQTTQDNQAAPAEGQLVVQSNEQVTPRNYQTDYGEGFADLGDRNVQELIGTPVASSEGNTIGEVDNFALVGQQLAAIVGIGGFLGMGEHEVALGLGDLTWDGEKLIVSGFTEDELRQMPEYDEGGATVLAGENTLRSGYETAEAPAMQQSSEGGDQIAVEGEAEVQPTEEIAEGAQAVEEGAEEMTAEAGQAAEQAGDAIQTETAEAGQEVEQTADEAGNEMAQAGQEVEQTAEDAGNEMAEAAQDVEQTAEEAGNEMAQAGQEAGQEVDQAAEAAGNEMAQAGQEVEQTAEDAGNEMAQAGQEAGQEVDQTAEAAGNEMAQAGDETEQAVDQATQEAAQAETEATPSEQGEVTDLAAGETEAESQAGEPVMAEGETELQTGDAASTEMAQDETQMQTEGESTSVAEGEAAAPADQTQVAEGEGGADAWGQQMDTVFADIADRQVAELVGMEVAGADGETVGEVDNFALMGQDVVAIVGIGGFLGLGEHKVALPLNDMTYDGERLVLSSLDEEQLKAMPEYDEAATTVLPDDSTLRGSYQQQ